MYSHAITSANRHVIATTTSCQLDTAGRAAGIEAKLDSTKRSYYETSSWNVAAAGEAAAGTPAWLIGIWNGQTDGGDCALASRIDGTNQVQLISCATFPKYAR